MSITLLISKYSTELVDIFTGSWGFSEIVLRAVAPSNNSADCRCYNRHPCDNGDPHHIMSHSQVLPDAGIFRVVADFSHVSREESGIKMEIPNPYLN